MDFDERDWKVLRDLKTVALDRYCAQVLEECARLIEDDTISSHDRYLRLYELIHERDKTLSDAFDGMSRSKAIFRLMAIRNLELITDDEFARFTPQLRERIQYFLSGG